VEASSVGSNADYYLPSLYFSAEMGDTTDSGDITYKYVDDASACAGKNADNGNGDGCYTTYWALKAGDLVSNGQFLMTITGAYKTLATTTVLAAAVAASLY